ncbi:hypothetical protein KXS11_10100 [Plantibacter flavus]|uniref:hypothetical protein n=1 Tax=Plantibacter flavus TaxID=150123 RepID=UPI003F185819
MKGKVLFVVGGLTGYVLGTRAGRERYEQIKTQWLKLWNAKPVRVQRTKVEDFAKARVSEVPAALWSGVTGIAKVVSQQGATPGQKLDRSIAKAENTIEDVEDAIEDAIEAKGSSKPAAKAPAKPAARKPAAAKPKPAE